MQLTLTVETMREVKAQYDADSEVLSLYLPSNICLDFPSYMLDDNPFCIQIVDNPQDQNVVIHKDLCSEGYDLAMNDDESPGSSVELGKWYAHLIAQLVELCKKPELTL